METRLGVNGTRLMGYVHGIHNSHNMPGAFDTSGVAVPGKTYYRNGTATATFSIGFPGYMNNCSTCHTATAMTSAVPSIQVSWATCMSCHVGPPTLAGTQTVAAGFAWAGFGVANTGTNTAPIFLLGGAQNHANFTSATTCAATACHGDAATGSAKLTLADFHNGQKTERNGLIWNGSDQSVIEGAKFALAITGVTRAAGNYQVTWTATYNGVAVDPCNADFAVGPVFLPELVAADAATGKSASNMSFVKAYGQGDDWVNANRTSASGVAPGQPATSPTLTVVGLPATATAGAVAPNTTCAANVATSTFTNDTATFGPAGTRAAMALQGKPQIRFAAAAGTPGEFIQVRAKSPVFNYTVPAADGAATAAAARRPVVDTAKCLACHKGTLYQHGGNRVDNVDLCDTCHNPASSDQNNRVTFFGVDATEAYDGKAAETYDMRTMIHSIHAAGENGRAWILYRTRGIYFFGNAASFADVVANKNWPTTGVTCKNAEGLMVTYSEVFGSVPGATEMVPVVKPDGTCDLTGGATPTPATHAWQVHNVVLVEYPRPLNQCSACHTGGSDQVFPDPTKAVAVTTNIGAVGVGATNGNQLDDTLIGPSVQSCMTCHQSGDAVGQAQLRAHGYQYGWTPAVFTNGRADLLNLVQVETCTVCHGAGKIADFKAAHNK
jgi:OmcA/MtrC family decaheme c-type cytochrome